MRSKYYLCNENNDLKELSQLVAEQNEKLYGEKSFTFIPYPALDNDIIIAETLDLGEGQLGAFARRQFFMGEVVAAYEGKMVFAKGPTETIRKKCRASRINGDYIWVVPCDDQVNSYVIDTRVTGSLGRFVNHVDQNSNCRITGIDGKAYYVATRNIMQGEELTTNYGNQYFDKKATSYQASHLNKILDKAEIASLFCYDQMSVKEEKQVSDQHQTLAVQMINDLYRDQSGNILFWGFPQKEKEKQRLQVETLSLHVGKKIEPSSDLKLIFSPIHLNNKNEKIFGMFAGQDIKNGAVVCEISGSAKLPKTKKPDEYVYVKDGKRYFYDSTCSESIFIHAANSPKSANVSIVNNNYVANQNIKLGCLLLCYFGPNHPFTYEPSTIQEVIIDFNQTQSSTVILFQQGDNLISISPKPIMQWKAQGPRLDEKAMSAVNQSKSTDANDRDQSTFPAHDGAENLTIETPSWMLEPPVPYASELTGETMINDVDKQRLMTAVPFDSISESNTEITTHVDRPVEKIEAHVEVSDVSLPLALPQSIWNMSPEPVNAIEDFITLVDTPPEIRNTSVNQSPLDNESPFEYQSPFNNESPSEKAMTVRTMSISSFLNPVMNECEDNVPESPGSSRAPSSSKFFSDPRPLTPHMSDSSLSNSVETPYTTSSSENATPRSNSTDFTPPTALLPVASPSSHRQTMETALGASQQSSAMQMVEGYLVNRAYYLNLIDNLSRGKGPRYKSVEKTAESFYLPTSNGGTEAYVRLAHDEFIQDLKALNRRQKGIATTLEFQLKCLMDFYKVIPCQFAIPTMVAEEPIISQQSTLWQTARSSKNKNTSSETTLYKKPKS